MTTVLREAILLSIVAVCGRLFLALALLAPLGWSGVHASGLLAPAEQNRLLSQIENQPMLFFVAKGPAGSCGPGCDEWIAAEGNFVPDTPQRFRDFLATLSQKNLPIFFHSRGGRALAAIQIGSVLRQRGMFASVGRTVTEGCRVFSKDDVACQHRISSGSGVKARLRTSEGQCHSACVYALVGGSPRRIPPGAILGVHSIRILAEPKNQVAQDLPQGAETTIAGLNVAAQKYFNLMGVDPRLVDMSTKVNPRRIYVLSRDEITRFGIETSGRYETVWFAHEGTSGRPLAMKAVTEPTESDGSHYRTIEVRMICVQAPPGTWVFYRREPASSEVDVPVVVRVAVDKSVLGLQRVTVNGINNLYGGLADRDFIRKALSAESIVFTESSSRHGDVTREIKLATIGLERVLQTLLKSCGER
jgi:hypothetical protein